MPLPLPPSENPPRSMTGSPRLMAASRASVMEWHAMLRAVVTPISSSRSMNRRRSSVSRIAATGVPSTRIPRRSSTPLSCSARPQLRAVWPPKASRMPSIFSRIAIFSTNSGVTGVR